MNIYTDEGLILRRFPYGEGDLILTILTKNHGKIKIVAKGVRKVNSRRGGHVDLFNYVEVQVREGRDLGNLSEVKAKHSFPNTKKSLTKIRWFYYLAEIVDGIIYEGEKNYLILSELVKSYQKLESHDLNPTEIKIMIRDLEIFLLRELGYWSQAMHEDNYPSDIDSQRLFNQQMISEYMEKKIKSLDFMRNAESK